ncbi:bifunctional phosphopantothenoylcysteine decarboxylase/phosphopantothenate--cysteine ligase CoaBC [Bombilactobacillus folatiphilus]|uniref:Coenzyme A biosynthesis bifunctional protein CoaBC n=1 Tax=Bombilactobacillus folatiphilus TaxID=2923362 RepID=A0ABY4P869_9LACO|nr:bifunctional phosphopantothenoylcysteine decarboxylase/phosphopantothenate--cysteine ligase CoaBC [Bombilactobacillus folatiphilus]UQS81905.1 bifunctional phosphopantothenoylcysteine decarboxylase/phosphopantothenate--cysteine ligase CoaBC [Bombilactobacillus folatiphilus]
MLQDKKITLYVTGSIAAYRALELTRLLIEQNAQVQVVLTKAAGEFVTPLSFQVLSQRPVYTDMFDAKADKVLHVKLAKWTDLAIVVPASADFLCKMAQGVADDLASLTLLATNAQKIVAPAMNDQMWYNPATQRNLQTLRADGVQIIEPTVGFLAEGYSGKGHIAEPEQIVQNICSAFQTSTTLAGKKIVVTAGGTRERIDPVRFLANDSSGKMGYTVAQSLQKRGATVILISGPTNLTPPVGVQLVPVKTSAQMHDAVLEQFANSDGLVMAAAVTDFRPVQVAAQKIKKTAAAKWSLELEKTPDILKSVAKIKQSQQITVGFAAETQNLQVNAQHKLVSKQLDLVVANDVSQPGVGFNGDTNQVTMLSQNQPPITTELLPKTAIADLIVEQMVQLLPKISLK